MKPFAFNTFFCVGDRITFEIRLVKLTYNLKRGKTVCELTYDCPLQGSDAHRHAYTLADWLIANLPKFLDQVKLTIPESCLARTILTNSIRDLLKGLESYEYAVETFAYLFDFMKAAQGCFYVDLDE